LSGDLVERGRPHPHRQRGLTLEESGCRSHPSRLVAACRHRCRRHRSPAPPVRMRTARLIGI
jgi:hypothetical protein